MNTTSKLLRTCNVMMLWVIVRRHLVSNNISIRLWISMKLWHTFPKGSNDTKFTLFDLYKYRCVGALCPLSNWSTFRSKGVQNKTSYDEASFFKLIWFSRVPIRHCRYRGLGTRKLYLSSHIIYMWPWPVKSMSEACPSFVVTW